MSYIVTGIKTSMLCCAWLLKCSPPGFSVHEDSPGKNTGVGCHALLQGIFPTQELNQGPLLCRQILYQLSYQKESEVAQLCPTLCDPMNCSQPGSSVHGDFPGKNTGVCCHALLQGIFPTQGSNLGLPHCRQILYHLSHQGSPRILEWVAYSFSRGSSQPRN